MSDFVHIEEPQVVVIGGAEGNTVVEMPNSGFAVADAPDAIVPEDIEVPDVVPYRASTPESDKMNVEALFKDGKITEDEMNARFAEIDDIAADPMLSPQEVTPEEVPLEEGENSPEPPEEDPEATADDSTPADTATSPLILGGTPLGGSSDPTNS